MIFFAATVALSLLGPLVNAQSNNSNSNTALGIAGIEANFQNAHIIPDLLSTFNPTAVMNVNFTGVGETSAGQNLTKDQVSTEPKLAIVPGSGFNESVSGSYTLVMVDADIVGTKETVQNQTCHWLVNGVTLGNSSSAEERNVSTTDGTSIIDYAGPAPADGSGPHRYVILLFAQPMKFSAPADLSKANTAVTTVNLTEYVSETNLSQPVAGMYFTVQQGTTNVSVPVTSAVVSSTLLPATASGSGTTTGASSKSTSKPNAAPRSGNPVLAIPVAAFLLFISYIYL
ncbi:phosphatidylethanolamine-binding protein [Russula dissimulans]|nr:phosphatidylethanolamine-binding protein [Russula dissimulans]